MSDGSPGDGAHVVPDARAYPEVSPDDDARLEVGATGYSGRVWGTAVNPATGLLLALAFADPHVGRGQLTTDVRHVRSQRALARPGADREGVLRRDRRRADGTVRDTVVSSVAAERWPAVRDGLPARPGSGR